MSRIRPKIAAIYVVLFTLSILMLMPVIWAAVSSLKSLSAVYAFPPGLDVSDRQWSNYVGAFTRLPLAHFLLNTCLISGISMVGAVLTSSMAGFALARFEFLGRRCCFVLIVVSLFIPAQVLIVPRFLLFDFLGWIGTYKPLIVPAWLGGGAFNILLFRQFFRTIPREFDEAARMDGATPWRSYWHVLLPMARPAVAAAAMLSFVYHWQEFLDPLLYLSDFHTYPISLGLRMYQSVSGTWANLLMAASLIALIPVGVVFVFCERFALRGLSDSELT